MSVSLEELKSLLSKNRSIRRFDASRRVGNADLENLVDLTRYCASGRNLQPMRYRIVSDEETCDKIFPLLAWAGYLTQWPGPDKEERPTAYIVQCLDESLTKNALCDPGLEIEAITLGAVTLGLGCCIIKAFNATELSKVVEFPENMSPQYVLAIGYPVEKVVLEDLDPHKPDAYKYYRDANGVHYVPKRPLSERLI